MSHGDDGIFPNPTHSERLLLRHTCDGKSCPLFGGKRCNGHGFRCISDITFKDVYAGTWSVSGECNRLYKMSNVDADCMCIDIRDDLYIFVVIIKNCCSALTAYSARLRTYLTHSNTMSVAIAGEFKSWWNFDRVRWCGT